ncbi:hypothetical protein KMW28_01865 [Flammeovirga yaeyamensis]|uniref:Signal peptidase I n=1 Tax=Flammeovirga yaeyamensis TaxID=367791 RepID=A0AAX1N4E3_9BACT|nr:DUF5684 domain-containing protein [Flammeovirga yaeyamensis]MBB3699833.1 cellulose synthase/poly-beta-1,6-N-acetylglucosamine synthase-like glycosyltransferase [Flammeovirga yaeyamensis]NMF36598.1 hypothetical protein [Flammeovirga yaeyamensis]QWG02355.1 hypothetical protein KMW28_01865 [Flammeovirga yaeyamensis]
MNFDFNNIFPLLFFLSLIITLISTWSLFEKAGKPGWAAFIPIYGEIVLLKIVGKPWWYIFFLFIPIINILIYIYISTLLAKSFGKGTIFSVGLYCLPIIFVPYLAFNRSSKYLGPAGTYA